MNLRCSILILFTVFQKVISKERSSSLIFAIDDTSSMSDEIAQVKLRTIEIFNAVLESNSSLIGNFLLVTLNDPGVVLRTITTSEHEFRTALDAIVVDGGGDCPEMALSGIELGIDSSNPESFLYVFTDASALDYTKYDIVSKKALMKGIEVTFLLTGNCGCESCPDYRVYNRLAAATGGQVFHLDKSDVSEVLKYIIDSIKNKNCLIDHILPKADGRVITHQFSVDCKMRDVTLSLSGRSPELKVYHVDGTEMMLTLLVKTENVYIAKLTSVAPGDYIAKVSVMPGDADLMIKGACSTSIRHGFSPFLPTSMKDTILNPSLGDKSLLAIELLNEDNLSDVNLLGVQIYDITGNPVMNLTLNIVNAKEKLYVSNEFIPPDKPFRIAIIGAAEDCAKKEVIRVTNPIIEPMPKGFAVFNQAPTIQKLEILTSDKDKVAILCKAGGYPKPEIIWKDKNGVTFSNATIAHDDLSRPEISSTLTIIDPEDNLFTCMATNAHGSDSDFVPIKLPKEPVIDKSVKKINKNKGEEVDIFCSLKQGNPKPEISWYFMGEAENEYVKLNETSESLHISSLSIDNSGSYHCKANNSEGSDSYTMDLFVPDVRDKTVNADAGELITLDCATGGISQPAVHWFINYREVFNGGRYIIHNNHSLSFKTNDFDSGRYECVSINRNQRKRKMIFEVEINPDFGFRVTRI